MDLITAPAGSFIEANSSRDSCGEIRYQELLCECWDFCSIFYLFFFFFDFGDNINNCHRAGKEVLTQKHEGSSTSFKSFKVYIFQSWHNKTSTCPVLVCHRSRDYQGNPQMWSDPLYHSRYKEKASVISHQFMLLAWNVVTRCSQKAVKQIAGLQTDVYKLSYVVFQCPLFFKCYWSNFCFQFWVNIQLKLSDAQPKPTSLAWFWIKILQNHSVYHGFYMKS